jgi:hypothetical protein
MNSSCNTYEQTTVTRKLLCSYLLQTKTSFYRNEGQEGKNSWNDWRFSHNMDSLQLLVPQSGSRWDEGPEVS